MYPSNEIRQRFKITVQLEEKNKSKSSKRKLAFACLQFVSSLPIQEKSAASGRTTVLRSNSR